MKKNNLLKRGITLPELLTVIIIILILFLAIFPKYSDLKKELALQRSAYRIAQDLRMVQEWAMSAKCSDCKISFDLSKKDSYFVENSKVSLEKGTEIINLSPSSPLLISFFPPNPDILINQDPSCLEAEITISNQKTFKKIKINVAGRIEIE